jgi:PAT family beta-lactamase induction signal transducer AmpG
MSSLRLYTRPRVLVMLALGFASGLPLLLSSATLLAWLTSAGLRVADISAFALVSLPYSLKVLWAPLIDRASPPGLARLGRRRGWMLLTQLLTCAALVGLSRCDPARAPLQMAALAALCAFFSATQDIAVDAYRTDLLLPEEAAAGTAVFVLGYRVAMIVAGALSLRLVDAWRHDFSRVYLLMALLLFLAALASIFGPDESAPTLPKTAELSPIAPPRTLRETVLFPLQDFFSRRGAVLVLLFLMLYRLGDMVLTSMVVPFLLRAGYTNTEVADATKLLGLSASIVGALCGGPLVVRLGLLRALFSFGVLQAATHLGYAAIAAQSAPPPLVRALLLYGVLAVDQFCAGLVVAASGALLISLCSRGHSATQYALLSSASGVLGRLFSGASGVLIERFGWTRFFLLTAVLSAPALLVLLPLRTRLQGALAAQKELPKSSLQDGPLSEKERKPGYPSAA